MIATLRAAAALLLLTPLAAFADPIAATAALVIGEGGVYFIVSNALTITFAAIAPVGAVRRRLRRGLTK